MLYIWRKGVSGVFCWEQLKIRYTSNLRPSNKSCTIYTVSSSYVYNLKTYKKAKNENTK